MSITLKRRTFITGLAATACQTSSALYGAVPSMPDFSALPPEKRADAERMFARMMAAMPYERTTVKGSSAFAEWERLKGLGKGWPVLVGDDDALERIAEQFTMGDPTIFPSPALQLPPPRAPSAILEAANHLTFPRDLNKWGGAYRPEDLHAPLGTWPETITAVPDAWGTSVAMDIIKGIPLDTVHVLFIPTEHSWEVPAYLRWGDWNACPPPEYHVAALRHWHDAFGAELVGIGGDRMDLRVKAPPVRHAEALTVAKEIYRYCPDSVDQGTQTLAALAATMVSGPWWNLWWD
ncbi:DUF4253 domain-containing protein [Novosphingobium terrae]|uniref:DUF4253 domain-containing protein n=1 Tax=Novosphingobium terrae TaxID=2726189 RepID=UPI001980B45D|nr:DUF4253 domain-containing protein [Novosphingobium terrae]